MTEYVAINLHDQLLLAKDALRGAESDHYRRSHEPPGFSSQENIEQLEERVAHWRTEVERLEAAIAEEADAQEDSPPGN